MGLALHPPESAFTERHLLPEPPRAFLNLRARDKDRRRRDLLQKALVRHAATEAALPEDKPYYAAASYSYSSRRNKRDGRAKARVHGGPVLDSDGLDVRLARSHVHLPGDGSRNRVPSFERQDAFWNPWTRKEVAARYHYAQTSSADAVEDAEVAELYRLGLLYDDERDRGSGFGLSAISHDEPVYTVQFRPIKSSRRKAARLDDAFSDGTPSALCGSISRFAPPPLDLNRVSDFDFMCGTETDSDDDDEMPVVDTDPVNDEYTDKAEDLDNASFGDEIRGLFGEEETGTALAESGNCSDSDTRTAHNNSSVIPVADDDLGDWSLLNRDEEKDDPVTTEDAATGVWIVLGDGS